MFPSATYNKLRPSQLGISCECNTPDEQTVEEAVPTNIIIFFVFFSVFGSIVYSYITFTEKETVVQGVLKNGKLPKSPTINGAPSKINGDHVV